MCNRCGVSIPEGGAQEHQDYHVALDLEEDPPRLPQGKSGRREASKGKKRNPPPPPPRAMV